MNQKVNNAIRHLSRILPLQSNLASLDKHASNVYRKILTTFFKDGKPPSDEPDNIIRLLADKDMITINSTCEITGAYPFIMEPRVHQVNINGYQLHAMCALDALAPGAMFKCQSRIDSQCAVTQQPLHIEIDNRTVMNSEPKDIYIGINWQAACSTQSCSDSLCTEMLFLSSRNIAENWLKENSEQREIFTLAEAIEFSAGFFTPLTQ